MASVIIVAAGRSTRMTQLPLGETGAVSSAPDKLFLPLGNCPVLAHCLTRAQGCAEVDEIVVVARAEKIGDIRALTEQHNLDKVKKIVEGGAERQDSVWNGLQAISDAAEIVVVHDGARPLFPCNMMSQLIKVARQKGSAVIASKVTDTIKEVDAQLAVIRTIDRQKLRAVQTPQVFQVPLLKRAYAHVRERNFHVTDEAAAVETLGHPIQLVECDEPNPKITTPLDLSYAELLLGNA